MTAFEKTPTAFADPTRGESPIYTKAQIGRELRQCEIISDFRQHLYHPNDQIADEIQHQYVIVLSQDCDLLWDFEARINGKPPALNGVLLYELHPAPDQKGKVASSEIWKRICKNKDERYQFLEGAPPEYDILAKGLPDLVIDFKRYFTSSPDEIYRQCSLDDANAAIRRCRVEMPYREHLQCRAAFYIQRVMLPLNHADPVNPAAKMLPPPKK